MTIIMMLVINFLCGIKIMQNYGSRDTGKSSKMLVMHDESLYMFSLTLSSIFKTAYPNHDLNKRKRLMSQFRKVIPRRQRETLNNQVMSSKLKNRKLIWEFIQRCEKLTDLDDEV